MSRDTVRLIPADESSWRLDAYLRRGGYDAARRAVTSMAPADIIAEVRRAGLRGRGGAGFPAGLKWSFVPQGGGGPKYLCVNADEGEPGTFKDRAILVRDPHRLLEGMVIAAFAGGIRTAVIYVRGEYERIAGRLREAVAEAEGAGFVGRNIFGSGHGLEVVIRFGAGAYICGEETALLESVEGRRGSPRLKPPFPAVVGLFQAPTVINNVETLANVPSIIGRGADWFTAQGLPKDCGTRLFSVSGAVRRPGLYELPTGISLRTLIEDHAGGPPEGVSVKAVIPGGLSAPVLTADELADAPGFRIHGPGLLDGRVGRRHRHRRPDAHARGARGHVPLLRPRVLRAMHALPRRDVLDPSDGDADRRGPRAERGPRSHPQPGRRDQGPDALPDGRRGGLAHPGPGHQVPRRARTGGRTMNGTKTVALTIDGRAVMAAEGTNVLRAAEQAGIDIPHFCYHPAFAAEGSCRMCLVEIEGLPKLELACSTPVREGLVVRTATPLVEQARRDVLEFLLADHPLDCPICDKAGECRLQDHYDLHGRFPGRFSEAKQKKDKLVRIGRGLVLDRERCILCTRCVRFLRTVTGTGELGIFERGARAEIGIFEGVPVDNDYAGNLADICPVGAITAEDFRFKTRAWFLARKPSVCPHCSRGCAIVVESVAGYPLPEAKRRVYRVTAGANPAVNGYWICRPRPGRPARHRRRADRRVAEEGRRRQRRNLAERPGRGDGGHQGGARPRAPGPDRRSSQLAPDLRGAGPGQSGVRHRPGP